MAFAKVLEQNRLHCTALTDKEGNGFVQFFVDDLDKIKRCVPEFADVLLRQQEWRLAQALAADPIDREAREGLTEAYAPSPEAARRAAQRATERAQERTAREHVVDDRGERPPTSTPRRCGTRRRPPESSAVTSRTSRPSSPVRAWA